MEENLDDAVELKSFDNEYEAELLVDNLKSQGIFAFMIKDDPAAMGIIRGAKVFVRKSDIEDALKLLNALED